MAVTVFARTLEVEKGKKGCGEGGKKEGGERRKRGDREGDGSA